MYGPAKRMIEQRGHEYTIQNATGGSGRDVPTYSDDGTLTGLLELRSRTASPATDSAGEEVETDLQIRTVLDNQTIVEAGESDTYPTKLIHPSGREFRVLDEYPEDSGVSVLVVLED